MARVQKKESDWSKRRFFLLERQDMGMKAPGLTILAGDKGQLLGLRPQQTGLFEALSCEIGVCLMIQGYDSKVKDEAV